MENSNENNGPKPTTDETAASPDLKESEKPEKHEEPLLLEATGTPDPAPAAVEPTWKPAGELSPEAAAALAANPTPAMASAPNSATPASVPSGHPVNAGLVVLQWLTYAFWGWTLLGLSFLVSMVFLNLIGGHDVGGFAPYGIAATLVLLPISFICDIFYAKREPEHKAGAETLVMVVHAVLFALFGIGALIAAVFATVQLMTSSLSAKDTMTMLFTSLIIAVYYGLTFLRTLNPIKLRKAIRWYRYVMLISVGVFAVLGIIGPVAKERTLRNDRLIESSLPAISQRISTYAKDKGNLPENLRDLNLDDESKKLLDTNLVTYKKEGLVQKEMALPGSSSNSNGSYDDMSYPTSDTKIYRYQLCVTFTSESTDYGRYGTSYNATDSDGYADYLSVYEHPAGNVCYKLKTNEYGY